MTKNIVLKIIGLEVLLMVFYTGNGAFSTITEPTSPVLQFIGLVPLAIGIFFYLTLKKKWDTYFFSKKLTNNSILFFLPLLLILVLIVIGNKGLNLSSLLNVFQMFIMQVLIVAFIEETFFRGFMIKMLLYKGKKIAVILSSFLFGITHMLQLFGGQSLKETIIQIIYAFLVGLVLSLLIINNQSILLTISFHGLNNFLNFMGNEEASLLYPILIIVILFVYTIFLWKRMNKSKNIHQGLTFLG